MKHHPIRRLYLLSILVFAVILAGCSGSAQSGGVASGDDLTVNIVAQDFEFTLDASQASPGTITFAVRNDGQMVHDFAISGNGVEGKTPMIDPGKTATLEVTLEPGTYSYVCTVPGHAQLGMKGTFTVAP